MAAHGTPRSSRTPRAESPKMSPWSAAVTPHKDMGGAAAGGGRRGSRGTGHVASSPPQLGIDVFGDDRFDFDQATAEARISQPALVAQAAQHALRGGASGGVGTGVGTGGGGGVQMQPQSPASNSGPLSPQIVRDSQRRWRTTTQALADEAAVANSVLNSRFRDNREMVEKDRVARVGV